ncbi:MAG: DUF4912 domain-containing protein [Treponema sp.]|jgi:hypothetical protein|nr:DUF4912 domain-containing protein [Treponema sp.]
MLDFETAEYKKHLESLSSRELIKLADNAGIDIPPDFERLFLIRELLEYSTDEEKKGEILAEKTNLKTVVLPKQYHITYLEVLTRDPQWAYVFWEVKALEKERYETDSRFDGYALRIFEKKTSQDSGNNTSLSSDFIESFTVPVEQEDNSRYLGFPRSGTYRILLLVQGLNIPLVFSRAFTLPRFCESKGKDDYFSGLRTQTRVSYFCL